jgi:hypothetical protein
MDQHQAAARPTGLFDAEVSHLSMAVFRILYHTATFWLMWDLWVWRRTAFAGHTNAAEVLLPLALLANAALVVGLWTRVFQVVNALLPRAVFYLCLDSYTADDVIENVSLLFALAPAPRALALDCWRRGSCAPLAPVPRWFVLLLFTSAALIYADGLYYKFTSEIWRRGSAFWLGAALPHISTGLLPDWAEVRPLMRVSTYAALVYETLFPLILVRRFRGPWAAVGLLVHAGSGAFMALPQFAMIMTALVAFLAPWERWAARPAAPSPAAAAVPPQPLAAAVAHALIALMVVGQLSLNLEGGRPLWPLCRALGLRQRAIFIDWHFRLPGPLFRLTAVRDGKEVAIPSFDRQGYPTTHDRYWKLFGFILRAGPNWREPAIRYATDWIERSGAHGAEIRAYCRDATVHSLDLDFTQDDEHERRPWILCGRFQSPQHR